MGAKRLRRWLVILAVGVAVGLGVVAIDRATAEGEGPTTVEVEQTLKPDGTDTAVPAASIIVARVTDGDTFRLRDGRRVRLIQIDAPEVGECFVSEATAALARRVPPGTRIVLRRDASLDAEDAHRRLLRYVFVDDTHVNLVLVRAGAAVPYFFKGQRGIYADELLAAAKEARSERRGLWGACPGAKLDPNRGALTGPA